LHPSAARSSLALRLGAKCQRARRTNGCADTEFGIARPSAALQRGTVGIVGLVGAGLGRGRGAGTVGKAAGRGRGAEGRVGNGCAVAGGVGGTAVLALGQSSRVALETSREGRAQDGAAAVLSALTARDTARCPRGEVAVLAVEVNFGAGTIRHIPLAAVEQASGLGREIARSVCADTVVECAARSGVAVHLAQSLGAVHCAASSGTCCQDNPLADTRVGLLAGFLGDEEALAWYAGAGVRVPSARRVVLRGILAQIFIGSGAVGRRHALVTVHGAALRRTVVGIVRRSGVETDFALGDASTIGPLADASLVAGELSGRVLALGHATGCTKVGRAGCARDGLCALSRCKRGAWRDAKRAIDRVHDAARGNAGNRVEQGLAGLLACARCRVPEASDTVARVFQARVLRGSGTGITVARLCKVVPVAAGLRNAGGHCGVQLTARAGADLLIWDPVAERVHRRAGSRRALQGAAVDTLARGGNPQAVLIIEAVDLVVVAGTAVGNAAGGNSGPLAVGAGHTGSVENDLLTRRGTGGGEVAPGTVGVGIAGLWGRVAGRALHDAASVGVPGAVWDCAAVGRVGVHRARLAARLTDCVPCRLGDEQTLGILCASGHWLRESTRHASCLILHRAAHAAAVILPQAEL